MSARTTAVTAIRSGFCAMGRHPSCPVLLGRGTAHVYGCTCSCHVVEDTLPPAPAAPAARQDAAVAAVRTSTTVARLADAWTAVRALDHTLGDWRDAHTADPAALAVMTGELRELRQHVAQLEAICESATVRAMTSDSLVLPDGRVAERKGGAKRTKWDHSRVAHRVAEYAVQSAAMVADPDTGELVLDEDLAAAVHAGVQELLACANPAWRTTALRKRDVRFDDLCDTEWGRRTLQLSAPAAEHQGVEATAGAA